MNYSSVPELRNLVVKQLICAARAHVAADGMTRVTLRETGQELQSLVANHIELFSENSFPAPGAEKRGGVRYYIYTNPDSQISLYLNAIEPRKSSPPHNHTTWAVIAAIEGEELNKIYQRVDDGRNPEIVKLEVKREFNVKKGLGTEILPDDIHSIHIHGDAGTSHVHLYGKSLESLKDRLGFNLETHAVVRFNQNHHSPSKFATEIAADIK